VAKHHRQAVRQPLLPARSIRSRHWLHATSIVGIRRTIPLTLRLSARAHSSTAALIALGLTQAQMGRLNATYLLKVAAALSPPVRVIIENRFYREFRGRGRRSEETRARPFAANKAATSPAPHSSQSYDRYSDGTCGLFAGFVSCLDIRATSLPPRRGCRSASSASAAAFG
jgi:hypothetical protein